MFHKREKGIFFLLSGLMLLSACSARLAEGPAPTPGPTLTATEAPAPSSTLEPGPTPEAPKELWGFPIDDTHDAFEVPTGGELGTVLVTVEIENEDAEEFQFSIWTADDLEKPVQSMSAERWGTFHWYDVVDANFDGYMDFGYMYVMGNQPIYLHYWIWNEEQGLFVAEPEFDRISCPEFDEETGVISGYARGGFAGAAGTTTFHQWIDGKLVCIRRIETFPYGGDTLNEICLTVEEPVDGVLSEIYRHATDLETAFDEVGKWRDLNYHGE